MVNRNHVRCHACGNTFAIRVTVAGGLQRFVFACPYCGTQVTGSFYAEQPIAPFGPENPPKPFELKSEDLDVLQFDDARETPEMRAVAVSTELPVHVSLLSAPVTERSPTPFIRFVQLVSQDEATADLMERINVLRQMRFELLPSIRRAATFYAQGDMGKLERALEQVPGFASSGLSAADPCAAVGLILQSFLAQARADARRRAARDELGRLFEEASYRDADAVRAFIADFNQRALQEHRRRVLDTFVRSLEANDALVPGLCFETVPDLDLEQYRIQRADFDELKSRYQDIFELGSRTLIVPASLANIVHRGDARRYCDDVRRSVKKALRVKAATREGWLIELPEAEALYDDSARKTRNLIGHRLISYDYKRAALIDDKGMAHNYLLFLRDYLGAVRSCAYSLDVVELLTTFEQRGASGASAA